MIPCLYGQCETLFQSNGIGKLCDAISCIVTEKRNGSYELQMSYPADGLHAKSLKEDSIILARPSEIGNPQPFRIYKVTTPLKALWGGLVEYVTVGKDKTMVFTLIGGTEMKA